jgi:hypothetical protein
LKHPVYAGKSYSILFGKSEKQRLLSEIKCKWKDNIKKGDKVVACEDVNWK